MNFLEKEKPYENIDVAIIGAGIIGLAVARSLANEGREVFIFEGEKNIGSHASSRNSEVIHSGIYYGKDLPNKARFCVEGKQMLYDYCREKGINHKPVGKLLVAATDKEVPKLRLLEQTGIDNKVTDLAELDETDIHEFEPLVHGVFGLLSPSTGIVDSYALMESLKRDAVRNGAQILLNTPVVNGRVEDNGIGLRLGDPENTAVLCQSVVNCAGLFASAVASHIAGLSRDYIPEAYPAKGDYFRINAKPFHHLVYPLPSGGGLGIHATVDLEGRVRFGPDVQWTDKVDYTVDESKKAGFYEAVRTYYPAIQLEDLQPAYAGIRAKLSKPGEPDRDFVISSPADHSIPGLVNLFGIESPGLTASMAIAEEVRRITS